MYVPQVYREEDLQEIRRLISAHPFATLVSHVQGTLWATHIPLKHTQDEQGHDLLQGHVAKKNPQWQELEDQESMAIFQGPDAYISSSWYHEESVPTWNYQAVHAYGRARILEGKELVESLKKLMEEHEAGKGDPLSFEHMSQDLFERESKGLIGFELRVDRFHAAAKLSQDKSEEDHREVTTGLERNGDPREQDLAKEMKKKRGKGSDPNP